VCGGAGTCEEGVCQPLDTMTGACCVWGGSCTGLPCPGQRLPRRGNRLSTGLLSGIRRHCLWSEQLRGRRRSIRPPARPERPAIRDQH
jgi:hypothetical protein